MDLPRDDVERAFGRAVSSYDVEPIDPQLRIHSITGGVYRVRADGDTAVVKVIRHATSATPDGLWGGDAEVSGRNYWKREWLAFDSGLLDALPGRLRAPRTLLTTERQPDECWIWMEDVQGRTGSRLELDDFDAIAFALGTMQGAYAAGHVPLPDQPWLSRNWLRGWVGVCARNFVPALHSDSGWDDQRIAPMRELRPRVAALWDHHEELLAIAESAPLTVAHWDFWPANLYVHGDGARDERDVVAIDWSQVGISGITHDLDQLTLDTVWMHMRPDESLDVLEAHVLPAYVDGLRAAGCDVDGLSVRRCYAAAAAARYAWLAGGQPSLAADAEAVQVAERRFGRSLAQVTATKSRVVRRAVELGEWALESAP